MNKAMKKAVTYELVMAVLALLVVVSLIVQSSDAFSAEEVAQFQVFDRIAWGIFVVDYILRLAYSKNKWHFVKNNKIDLLVIIPFESLFVGFRIFRLLRLVKLLRAFIFLSRFTKGVRRLSHTNNFHYIALITMTLIILGAFSIAYVEDMAFDDALWWAFVTTTTVGYGDISPATNAGRVIAVILMLVGIGFIGTLTGTIATFFLREEKTKLSYKKQVIEHAREKLGTFDELTEQDLFDMFDVLRAIKIKEELRKKREK